jgi:hypothetical protein
MGLTRFSIYRYVRTAFGWRYRTSRDKALSEGVSKHRVHTADQLDLPLQDQLGEHRIHAAIGPSRGESSRCRPAQPYLILKV